MRTITIVSHRLGLVMVAGLMTCNLAWAGSQLESTRSSCGVINCAGMTVRGIHQANEPFVVQVYAREGECLRLDIDVQTEDMAILLLSPSVNFGLLNDDRDFAGGDTRPLIATEPIPWTGWYTVVVSYFDLDKRVARFNLNYGRYPAGNLNCQPAPAASAQRFQPMGGDLSKAGMPAAGAADDDGQDD